MANDPSADDYIYSPDGRRAWTRDRLHEYELGADGTYVYAGPGPGPAATGSPTAGPPTAKADAEAEPVRPPSPATDAAAPKTPERPAPSPPVAGNLSEWLSWSRGETRNYLAVASAIGALISVVLLSLIGALVTGFLALFAERWAVAHDDVGRRLAGLSFFVALLTMIVSNLVTNELL